MMAIPLSVGFTSGVFQVVCYVINVFHAGKVSEYVLFSRASAVC